MSQVGIYNPCTPPIRLKRKKEKAPSNKSENKNPYKETGVFVNKSFKQTINAKHIYCEHEQKKRKKKGMKKSN